MIQKQRQWLFSVADPEILEGYPIKHSYFAPTAAKAEALLRERFGPEATITLIREELITCSL